MYMFPEMLKLTKIKWKSKDHQIVAENCLICNPAITTLDNLIRCAKIINKIPKNKIRTIKWDELIKLGVSVKFN